MITVLVISNCTIPMNDGPVRPSRTGDLLKAGYSWEQIQEAKINGTIDELVKEARESGAVERGEQRIAKAQAEKKRQIAIAQAEEKKRIVKAEAQRQQRIAQAKQAQYENLIKQYQSTCRSYGFNEDNAIATCVQREINLERDRIQGRLNALNAQQNQQIYQDNQRRNQALSNYGRCLSTQGETFSSCSNAWQGYTPPKKTETNCRYNSFGNVIRGTCTSTTQ